MYFIDELRRRNSLFFYSGLLLFAMFIAFLISYSFCPYAFFEICHWLKPGKFALSFAVFLLTLGWYMEYLKGYLGEQKIKMLSRLIVFLIFAELVDIFLQSWLVSDSDYRFQIPTLTIREFSRLLYLLGNGLILVTTSITIYIGLQFFRPLSLKPTLYLWGIRAGFIVFIVSSILGGFLVHKYGQVAADPSHFGIPFTQFVPKRNILISLHFLGIHYLQLIPLCCFYFEKYLKKTFVYSAVGIYFLACILVLFA
jgi:hypothetical protein